MASDVSHPNESAPVWCSACGIPHPAGTAYCSHCGRPLGEGAVAGASPAPAAVTVLPTRARAPLTGSLRARATRRSGPASDEEIDAAAAAIVARAMALEARPAAPESAAPGKADSVPTTVESPLPLSILPARERLWVYAGLALCLLVMLIAIIFARSLSVAVH